MPEAEGLAAFAAFLRDTGPWGAVAVLCFVVWKQDQRIQQLQENILRAFVDHATSSTALRASVDGFKEALVHMGQRL